MLLAIFRICLPIILFYGWVYILVQFFRNLIIKSVNVEDQFMSDFTLIRHGKEGALQNHETEDQEKRGKTEEMVERLEYLVK